MLEENVFKDVHQRQPVPHILMKKNKGGIFFRFIESSKKNRVNEVSHSSFNRWRKN